MKQSTNNILLIRPANFGFNAKTAISNKFQHEVVFNKSDVLAEFDTFSSKLKENGVNVIVFEDTLNPPKPDAIFPNNWLSCHSDGTVILYPMSEGRRDERRIDIVEKLKENFRVEKILDYSEYETKGEFLEGTGSIVFDHENKIAYACLSPRTNKKLFEKITRYLGYQPISFHSYDENSEEIYHTNVMMCIGTSFSIICLESIKCINERTFVNESLQNSGLEIIEISFDQMNHFAGNMLNVLTDKNESLLVLSENAFKSLKNEQKRQLENYCRILPLSIPTIEKIGGGSTRCMMAEIFLPRINQLRV